MSELKQVVGALQGIKEKTSGWFEVELAVPGAKYPLKLETKRESLITDARETHGETATWTYKESESERINEHTGKPFLNRYFEGVELGASAQEQASSEDRMSKDEWAAKDSAIHMMACIKTAADALKHTIPSDPSKENLSSFKERVKFLSHEWHLQVLAIREGDERDIPFNEKELSEHDSDIPF